MKRNIIILLSFLSSSIFAQSGIITGQVLDNSGLPLIGANVIVENTLFGTATDSEGRYRITNLKDGDYKISVSVIGYAKVVSEFVRVRGNSNEVNFNLEPTSYQFDQLIITADKLSKEIKNIAATTYVLDQKIFSEKNYKQIDDALRYVPGIVMTDDQLSIRGSSGYSRGAGTRILVTIDEIPIYTPDAGDIIWELVPISEIGRVEIIKGSASSLYGSSAIGGVVNIESKEISANPVTYIKFLGGFYSKPSHKEWEWTDETLTFNSQTVSHSRTINKLSLSASVTRFEDYSYRKNDYQLRFAGFFKSAYQFSESTSLTLIGTGYTRDSETFNYWQNIENALTPPTEDLGQHTDSDRTIVGLTFNHIFNDKFSISIIPSAYFSFWKDDSESRNNSDSRLYRSEFRGNLKLSENVDLVSGIEIQFSDISSNIFGIRNSNGIGLYSQADYRPSENINLSVGLRYDYSRLADLESSQALSPKIGITYKFNSTTTLRGLFSKGFRAPSLAEAFTSTTASGLTVKPNPDIKSESSYSMELGVNHIFSKEFNIDLSLFNNEYYDMIEPGFDPKDGEVFFNNVTRARIQGTDISSNIVLYRNINLNIGYTFLWARDIKEKRALNYRPRHSILLGLNYDFSIYEFGADFRYLSRIENIDFEFVELGIVPDGDKRVEIFMLDANAGLNLFKYHIPARLFLRVSNLLNYNYVELIGNIAPIRNYSLNLELIF